MARVGRTPSWCSATCRHRAWETRRAAAADELPVRVVDRIVEVERLVPVVQEVEVPALPRGAGWAPALHELARQIDTGKLYDRDLPDLTAGLTSVLDALAGRQGGRARR